MLKKLGLSVAAWTAISASTGSYAKSLEITENTLGFTAISATEVRSYNLCPPNVICITNGTVVELDFQLSGCEDNLHILGHHAVEVGGKLHIDVVALNESTKESQLVRCAPLPTVQHKITLVNRFGEVDVHFVGAE